MKNKIFTAILSIFISLSQPTASFAADPIFTIPNISGFTNPGKLIDNIVQLIFFVAGLAFFINFMIGGLQWINAGGDAKAMDSARNRITNSFIGLIIVVAAFAITKVVESVFGITITGGFNFGS